MTSKSHRNFFDSARKIVGKAINRYNLIEADEGVLVALSGGKDSLVLLDTLVSRLKYIPVHYHIHAAYISIEEIPQEVDISYLSSVCSELGVKYHYKNINLSPGLDSGKSACFLCSSNRRKELFKLAKDLGCKKIAFGHHMNDIVETLIMNMTMHGKFSTMPVKLSIFQGTHFIIRPLALLTEDEVTQYAKLKQFRYTENMCGFGDNSRRREAKRILFEMNRMSGKAMKNIFNSMSNIDHEYLACIP